MSDIRINQLVLENFKCHRFLKLDFNGKNAGIFGDNAAGKTSVYDGLCWLLFGKDSAGNGEKNIDIKPLLSDGSVADHKAITSVEVVFDVDGEEIVLKPGQSLSLYPGYYHEYVVRGDVLVGEVSMCNDDANDNCFYEPVGRFPAIEEDEPPYRLLCTEYPAAKD